MFSFVYMKILESVPSRYDWGIKILTFGRISRVYDRLTSNIKKGDYVLDIGCGTGALTMRAAIRGATVVGMDINPEMMEIAREKGEELGLSEKIEFIEMGVAELGEMNEKFGSVQYFV